MKKIRNFEEFLVEKKSPFKKATLIKYKKKFEKGEEIPFNIENSLKAQGLIPRADGEIRVSDEYKDIGDKLKDALKSKSPEKKKIIKESFEETMKDAEVTATYHVKEGHIVEIREMEGTGMAGEPMTFAYIFENGEVTTREHVKSHMKASDFKDLCSYLDDVAYNNEDSAISFLK